MKRAEQIVKKLLESTPPEQVLMAHFTPDELDDIEDQSFPIWLDAGFGPIQVNLSRTHRLLWQPGSRIGIHFHSEEDLDDYMTANEAASGEARSREDVERHVYRAPQDRYADLPEYSLAQREPYVVYHSGPYIFLKIPNDPDYLQREGVDMQHPVHGDTGIITYDGIVPIRTLAGSRACLLTRTRGQGFQHSRWVEARVESFGHQALWKVTLKRNRITREVLTTASHRWYAFNNTRNKQNLRLLERTTAMLEVGDRVPSVYGQRVLFKSESPKGVSLSAYGVAHGIVFGDGHACSKNQSKTARPARITLYGKKDAELLKWFPEPIRRQLSTRSVGGVTLNDIPRYFKHLPSSDESASYLIGWLAGYLAADGSMNATGCSGLYSAMRHNLEFAEMVCQRFGIRTTGISSRMRKGYGKTALIHHLGIEVGALPDDFFLLADHRKRNKPRAKATEHWTVLLAQPTDTKAEVFCAIVPETGCFVLEGNILTGNCLSVVHHDYCKRQIAGEIENYSMVDTRDNKPKVDVELALKKSSYSHNKIERPSVTQIRGLRNQMPPRDELLPALMDFLTHYGKDWQLTGHGVRNFDNRLDGEETVRRARELGIL